MLLAVFLTRGSNSLTKENYKRVRKLLTLPGIANERSISPHYSTLTRVIFPFLRNQLFPTAVNFKVSRKSSYTIERPQEDKECDLYSILPSSWTINDLKSEQFHDLVFREIPSCTDFESSPFVQHSNPVVVNDISVPILNGSHLNVVELNDYLKVTAVPQHSSNATSTTEVFEGRASDIRLNKGTQTMKGLSSRLVDLEVIVESNNLTSMVVTFRYWKKHKSDSRIILAIERNTSRQVEIFRIQDLIVIEKGNKKSTRRRPLRGNLPDGTPCYAQKGVGGTYIRPASIPLPFASQRRFIHPVCITVVRLVLSSLEDEVK